MFARGVPLRVCDTCHTPVHPFRRAPVHPFIFPGLTLSGIFYIPQPSSPPLPLCFQAFSTCFNPIPPFSIIYAWSHYDAVSFPDTPGEASACRNKKNSTQRPSPPLTGRRPLLKKYRPANNLPRSFITAFSAAVREPWREQQRPDACRKPQNRHTWQADSCPGTSVHANGTGRPLP